MTVGELKQRLEKMSDTAIIHVMIEVDSHYEGDNIVPACQFEFPANDLAYSSRTDTVIIMYERGEK
jgi:hypothetical protein